MLVLLSILVGSACRDDAGESSEAEVGGDRRGCGDPDSHSLLLADHSCVCELGYSWCGDALDDFDCCPSEDSDGETGETGGSAEPPTLACDADALEQLTCVPGPGPSPDPTNALIWSCNGERWVEVPDYPTFACLADGFPFAYGCIPGQPPSFACGFGQGSSCDPLTATGVCVDDDIIDTCIWGLRTVDRCSRLCTALTVFGIGFDGGSCSQPDTTESATCECCVGC